MYILSYVLIYFSSYIHNIYIYTYLYTYLTTGLLLGLGRVAHCLPMRLSDAGSFAQRAMRLAQFLQGMRYLIPPYIYI